MFSNKNRYFHRKLVSMLVLLALLMYCGSGYIYASSTTSVTNNFETGLVAIELEQYEKQADGELKVVTQSDVNDLITPNEQINRIERIQNNAADCYVRLGQEWTILDVVTTTINSSNWVMAEDGYIYCKNIVKSGEYVDLDITFGIPEDLDESYAGQKLSQSVKVDAIQSANFIPNFDSSLPWGNVQITNAISKDGESVSTIKGQELTVVYKGDSKELVKNADNAFVNFATLMPGDVYSDSLILSNDADKDINLYFKSDVDGNSRLYDALQLKIIFDYEGNSKVLYDGTLSSSEISTNVLLSQIAAHKGGTLKYTLTFPEEYDNAYSLMDGNITWIFSTVEIDGKEEPPIETGDKMMTGMCLAAMGTMCLVLAVVINSKDKKAMKVEK